MAKTPIDIRSLARSHTAKAAAARLSAAIALLDRGWGKPPQAIEMDWRQKPANKMTDEELIAIINETNPK
jgi:hypothetical protein